MIRRMQVKHFCLFSVTSNVLATQSSNIKTFLISIVFSSNNNTFNIIKSKQTDVKNDLGNIIEIKLRIRNIYTFNEKIYISLDKHS